MKSTTAGQVDSCRHNATGAFPQGHLSQRVLIAAPPPRLKNAKTIRQAV
jgi:hypothetical protein